MLQCQLLFKLRQHDRYSAICLKISNHVKETLFYNKVAHCYDFLSFMAVSWDKRGPVTLHSCCVKFLHPSAVFSNTLSPEFLVGRSGRHLTFSALCWMLSDAVSHIAGEFTESVLKFQSQWVMIISGWIFRHHGDLLAFTLKAKCVYWPLLLAGPFPTDLFLPQALLWLNPKGPQTTPFWEAPAYLLTLPSYFLSLSSSKMWSSV